MRTEATDARAAGASPPKHAFLEHTGEVRLEVSAHSREEIFEEAGRALAELMLGDMSAPDPDATLREVSVEARDPTGLLVDFINELIFLSETSKEVFTRIEILELADTRLRAQVSGVHPSALETAVKAATFHGAAITREAVGFSASVVLDV